MQNNIPFSGTEAENIAERIQSNTIPTLVENIDEEDPNYIGRSYRINSNHLFKNERKKEKYLKQLNMTFEDATEKYDPKLKYDIRELETGDVLITMYLECGDISRKTPFLIAPEDMEDKMQLIGYIESLALKILPDLFEEAAGIIPEPDETEKEQESLESPWDEEEITETVITETVIDTTGYPEEENETEKFEEPAAASPVSVEIPDEAKMPFKEGIQESSFSSEEEKDEYTKGYNFGYYLGTEVGTSKGIKIGRDETIDKIRGLLSELIKVLDWMQEESDECMKTFEDCLKKAIRNIEEKDDTGSEKDKDACPLDGAPSVCSKCGSCSRKPAGKENIFEKNEEEISCSEKLYTEPEEEREQYNRERLKKRLWSAISIDEAKHNSSSEDTKKKETFSKSNRLCGNTECAKDPECPRCFEVPCENCEDDCDCFTKCRCPHGGDNGDL